MTAHPSQVRSICDFGTRRLHLNTGEVWRVVNKLASGTIVIAPECGSIGVSLERRRQVRRDYWLGDSWGEPRGSTS